jgi:C4-dicarboxylate-specific signal transduction histidine kinase
VTEKLAASELIEDALQINGASLARHHIDIVREFARVPAVIAERHKVIQVLINLIRNAKQALAARERDRLLTLRIEGNGNGRVRITVKDNGSGIDAAAMPRLFSHGFTTKAGGHGFGLHNSSLAVREMGGTLTAASDGPDQGAEFTIELPATDA